MFTEPARYAHTNREQADSMHAEQALLDGGSRGIVLFHTNRFFIMTQTQATNVASMLIDQIEECRKANTNDR